MKNLILFLIFSFLIYQNSISQSSYLNKNQSGFLFDGGLSTNNNSTGFSGGFGYSFLGKFDLGLSVGRYSYNEQFLGEDLYSTSISPSISFIPIKQNERIPLSIELSAFYHRSIYSNQLFTDYNIDMTDNATSFGTSLFTKIPISESMSVQPNIGVSFISVTSNVSGLPEPITEKNNVSVVGLGIDLIFKTSSINSFIVTPSIAFSKDATGFGIYFGYLIPQK